MSALAGLHNSDTKKEIDDLWLLWWLTRQSALAAFNPLARTRWIDSGTTTPATNANGSVALPYNSITNFINSLPVTPTLFDGTTWFAAIVSPGTYTENVSLPAYRNLRIRAEGYQQRVTGALTWNNQTPAGPPGGEGLVTVVLENLSFSGNATITDNATQFGTLMIGQTDSPGVVSISGNVVATGAQQLNQIQVAGGNLAGQIISTATVTGCTVNVSEQGQVAGNITARAILCQNAILASQIIQVSNTGSGAQFFLTVFQNPCSLQVAAGSLFATFDGFSWASFQEIGGTLGPNVVVTIVGGYTQGVVNGANLTDANNTITLNGSGASPGFTGGGNLYTMPAATMSAARTITLGVGGAKKGDTLAIMRRDVTANTLTIQDDAATTLAVFPINLKSSGVFQFNGTHFVPTQVGSDVT